MKIEKIKNINDLLTIQPIYLNCLLMSNNEILFCGRSLGFITEEEIKAYAFIEKGEKNEKI